MKVLPSIDLSEGKVVKRIRGVRGTGLIIGDPINVAKEIYDEGYDSVHIVDLDSAEGVKDNEEYIKEICKLGFDWIQVGGGIRDLEKAKRLISYGCSAIIISTLPIINPSEYFKIVENVGEDKVLLSVDYNSEGYVLIKGWKEKGIKVKDFLESFKAKGYIFTFVDNEGTKKGIDKNVKAYLDYVKGVKEYAGGVSSLQDLLELKQIGFDYAIVGMSFYNGTLRGIKYV